MIAEPVTLLTDYALAAVAACFAWRLYRDHDSQSVRRLWAVAFSALAIAALAGGTYHGFAPQLNAVAQAAMWKVTVYSVGVFDLAMLAGSILAITGGRLRRALLSAALLKFAAFAIWMIGHDDFSFVIADSAGAMLGLLLLHGWSALVHRDAASRRVLGALLLSALAAGVQYSGLALHPHFNHNDLYHVIQIVAMVFFHSAGKRLRDRASSTAAP